MGMKSRVMAIVVSIIFSIAIIFSVYLIIDSSKPVGPITNSGEKWHLGYYQGGDYQDYVSYLKAFVKGLEKAGWVSNISFLSEEYSENAYAYWTHFNKTIQSDYVTFDLDNFWNAEWNSTKREEILSDFFFRGQRLLMTPSS